MCGCVCIVVRIRHSTGNKTHSKQNDKQSGVKNGHKHGSYTIKRRIKTTAVTAKRRQPPNPPKKKTVNRSSRERCTQQQHFPHTLDPTPRPNCESPKSTHTREIAILHTGPCRRVFIFKICGHDPQQRPPPYFFSGGFGHPKHPKNVDIFVSVCCVSMRNPCKPIHTHILSSSSSSPSSCGRVIFRCYIFQASACPFWSRCVAADEKRGSLPSASLRECASMHLGVHTRRHRPPKRNTKTTYAQRAQNKRSSAAKR